MPFLFADIDAPRGLLAFAQENWHVLLPCVLVFVAVYYLLPKARGHKPLWAGMLGAAALALGAAILIRTETVLAEAVLFYAFSGLAIGAGGMMITQKHPVHAALSFALVVLSTCGLFLLQAAPFLMAATIIVYAGAIVVTFLFVIMLAQQEGASSADQRSREPFLASLAGCIFLGSLLCILHKTYDTHELDSVLARMKEMQEVRSKDDLQRYLVGLGPHKEKVLEALERQAALFPGTHPVRNAIDDLPFDWQRLDVGRLQAHTGLIVRELEARRNRHGSIALDQVPGKEPGRSSSHFTPGKLPASNVAALGRTLFTDYLIAVELAAVLLLVATIGAIAIIARRSEVLR